MCKEDLKQSYLLLFSLVFILSILLMKVISLFQYADYSEIGYIYPAPMGAMLIKILIDEKLAMYYTIIMAISGSIIFNEGVTGTFQLTSAIYILCAGLAAILFLTKQNRRSKILQAGLFVTAVNILVIFSLLFLRNGHYETIEYGFYFIIALISGISSAVLAIGLFALF